MINSGGDPSKEKLKAKVEQLSFSEGRRPSKLTLLLHSVKLRMFGLRLRLQLVQKALEAERLRLA